MSRNKFDWAEFWMRVVFIAIQTLLSGWCLAQAVVVIRAAWIDDCPGLGFWPAVLIAMLVRAALYTHNWNRSDRS